MAKYSNTIEYNISTKLDSKGLTQLQQQLKQIEITIQKMDNQGILGKDIADARTQIQGLSTALSEAFNPSLGMVDLAKFNSSLKDNGVSATQLRNALQLAGADGQVAFNNLVGQLGRLDLGLKRSSSSLNKIATTFGNTFRWGLIASFFSNFMNAIHSSVDYVHDLDDSLTQIMLVTDYNRDAMNEYARSANEAAKALSNTTVGVTNASLIFAQQGFNLEQSGQLAELSIKLANASQQDTATTSDQITAYMNAYGLSDSIEDLTAALDSWALVANVSAADVSELATASQKAASTANAVGVSMDQLNAQIATIESVTRDAPEQIGNGLKTIYARFSDIKLGKTLEDGVNLGQVTGQLNKLGVQVLDEFGSIRNTGDILEDLMVIWDDLDQTTKEAAAQTLAGKFQMNRFLALMENSDMYREYLGYSQNASGTLDQMQAEYADSMEGRLNKLYATFEGLVTDIVNTDTFYPLIDGLTKLAEALDTVFKAVGDGPTIILGLASALTRLFSSQIAQGINDFNINQAINRQRAENFQNSAAALNGLGVINPNPNNANSQQILTYAQKMNEMQPYLSQDQAKQSNEILLEMIQNSNDLTLAQQKLKEQMDAVGAIAGAVFKDALLAPFEENGVVNYQLLNDELSMLKGTIEGSGPSIEKLKENLQEFQITFADLKDDPEALRQSWEQLKTVLGNTSFGEHVSEVLKNISQDSRSAADEIPKLTREAERLREVLNQYSSGDISKEKFLQEIEKLESLSKQVQLADVTAQNSIKVGQASSAGMDSQKRIKEITDTVSALGQLAFAIQTVQNLGSIWKNENLTTGEKVIQTITNLSMVIPSVVSIWKTLSTATVAQTIAEKAEAIQTAVLAGAKTAELKVTKELAKAEAELAFVRQFGKTSAGGRTAEELETLIKELKDLSPTLTKLKGGFSSFVDVVGTAGIATGFAVAAVAALIGIIGVGVWKLEEAKKKAWEFYETTIEITDKLKELQSSIKEFNDNFSIFEETGENGDKLIEQAEKIADALREAGAEEQAQAIHLAAVRAEAAGTAESFENLANAINDNTALTAAYENIIQSSADVLNTQNVSFDFIVLKLKEIKELQREIDGLDPWSFDSTEAFESYRQSLETQKRELEEQISVYEEATTAVEGLINAQGALAGIYAADLNGGDTKALGWENQAGPPDAYRTVDTETLRQFFSQNVQGFNELYNDLEQIDFMLQYVTDDAQRADLQMQQLLRSNKNLTSQRSVDYGAGDIGTSSDYLEIAGEMQRAGFSAQEQLQLIATLDENASREEILNAIHRVQQYMDNGDSFSLALQAGLELNPQEIENMVRSQLADYQPTDEDVNLEDFQTLSNLFLNTNQLGQEGTPFADYSEELINNAIALEDVVEGILRYNDAIETINKNMDDWKEALSDSNEFSSDHIKAVQELQETYADFLDLSEDLGVSEEFAANADNLELMEAAANGVEGAYEDLAKAAANDILIHADVDNLDAAQNALQDIFNFVDTDLANLDVGESFDLSPIEEQINNLATATGWTADQMVNYLNSIGIQIDPSMFEPVEQAMDQAVDASAAAADAIAENGTYSQDVEVESATMQNQDTMQYYSAIPQIGYETWNATLPVNGVAGPQSGGGGASSGTVPRVTYTLQPATAEKIDQTTVTKTGSKVKKGSSTGTIRLKSGAKGTKGNTGGAKYAGGSRAPSSKGKGGGGGGGKGKGGGKAKTIEPLEKKEHKKDYYEEVDSQLDKLQEQLQGIEKEEDRLIGKDARDNQNKQLTLLQKEIELQEEKLKILKEQELVDVTKALQDQDAQLEKILRDLGINFKIPAPEFDEDGIIANYEEMNKAITDGYNKLVDKYNQAAAAGNEEVTKSIKEQMDKYDKLGDTLLNNAQRYDDIQKEVEDLNNAIEELKDAIEDIQIAAYKASQEAIDDLKKIREEAAELKGIFRDFDPDSFVNAFSIDETPYEKLIADLEELHTIYSGDDSLLAASMEDLERLQGWLDGTNEEANPFGDNQAALLEAYENAYKRTLELAEDYRKTVQDTRDDLLDIYDTEEDALDRVMNQYDRLLDNLERIGDTYALYYGDDSYDQILNIMQQQGNTMQSQLDQLQRNYQYWYEQYQQALDTGDKKLIEEIEDKMNDAEDAMLDKAEELAEHWVEMFEKSVDASLQKMTDNIWGKTTATVNPDGSLSDISLGLDDLQTKWELEKQYVSDYKDEVEKAYEIDKLRSKYIDLLNDAQGASLGTQNKIRQEMENQLAALQDQATVSEYDVKLANARLEILQKQIALEDAQRNKNKMQLRRDTQGNYRYVYRADEGDVKKAQDELLDSTFDVYELTKDQYIENNDRAFNLYSDMLEKISAISNRYKDDEVARNAALQEILEQYKKMFEALGEDFGDVTNGMYEVLWWNIENLTGNSYEASVDKMNQLFDESGNMRDATGEMWFDLANQIETDVIDRIDEEAKDTIWSINSSAKKLETNISSSLDTIGSDLDNLDITLEEVIDTTERLKAANDRLFDAFSGDSPTIQNAMKEISNYRTELEKTQASASKLAQQLEEANKTIAALKAENLNYRTQINNSTGSRKKGSSGGSGGGSGGSSGGSGGSSGGSGGSGGGSGGSGGSGGGSGGSGNSQTTIDLKKQFKNAFRNAFTGATGGYTGEWGSEGRLAILHQKELVLNANDTSNILAAVDIMRNITAALQNGLSYKTDFSASANNIDGSFGDTIKQRVEITANFPNVTNADQIEAALLGLSDKAYQYSYRTR